MEKKNKGGRPTKYNEEIVERICHLVSTNTMGLPRLCKQNPDLPNPDTIYEWRIKYKDFSDKYAEAKRNQVEMLVDEILDIADDKSNDTTTNDEGKTVCNTEYLNRSRLRIDTRKWLAAKLAPKIYGDKLQTETTVISPAQMIKALD
jgi:hypothetical protein